VAVRDTTRGGDGNINFLFEGSQAMPASPSDRGEILFKVIEVRGAALNVRMAECSKPVDPKIYLLPRPVTGIALLYGDGVCFL
jgi:hypothetical protein